MLFLIELAELRFGRALLFAELGKTLFDVRYSVLLLCLTSFKSGDFFLQSLFAGNGLLKIGLETFDSRLIVRQAAIARFDILRVPLFRFTKRGNFRIQ